MNRYERLAVGNADLISRLEGVLRSLTYMIPGRFDDSILVSEILYAVLKCFKHVNDAIYHKHYKHAASTTWNQYLHFMRGQSPVAGALVDVLLFVRFVEVPVELVVRRFAGLGEKSVVKGTIWWLTEFRMVPSRLEMDTVRPRANQLVLFPELRDPKSDLELRIIAMDQCCEGKTVEERTRSFIRDTAPKPPPQNYFEPQTGVLARSRELAHICRPALYAVFMLLGVARGGDTRKRWQLAGWLISLCMDYFSCWPELQMVLSSGKKEGTQSVEEVEEGEFRLLRMGLYMFREPFFADHTKPWLTTVVSKFEGWRLLTPLVTTARAYLALCEESLLYLS